MRLLVTGCCGFIGSNFVRYMFESYQGISITNIDKLTYAGNTANLRDIEAKYDYTFVHGDIADEALVEQTINSANFDVVVNFAAESHVDRSITRPREFIETDVLGTFTLIDTCRRHGGISRFIQISTDEVYGSIIDGSFSEQSLIQPNSPYSASKSGADLLVRSYFTTYGFPAIVTRSSNNFGPYQYPEKVIPLFITNALEDKKLPLYGDGMNVRDWLYVVDNCRGIDLVIQRGIPGEVYNIGGGQEMTNIDLTRYILYFLSKPETLIEYVQDRPGHDRRYSLDISKIRELGYEPTTDFPSMLRETVQWYVDNRAWWEPLK